LSDARDRDRRCPSCEDGTRREEPEEVAVSLIVPLPRSRCEFVRRTLDRAGRRTDTAGGVVHDGVTSRGGDVASRQRLNAEVQGVAELPDTHAERSAEG